MGFSHIDDQGNANMVDVGGKAATRREASAVGCISMNQACFDALQQGANAKGDVLGTARVAGIMAAKRTAELIPLCHTLALDKTTVDFTLHADTREVAVRCTVRCEGRTGVEMEALTGASVALLTVYDMCKAMDKRMVISGIQLAEKTGGKSGHFVFDEKES